GCFHSVCDDLSQGNLALELPVFVYVHSRGCLLRVSPVNFRDMFVPKLIVCFREGYSWKQFLRDLQAGAVVGMVALPLAMAFSIACGLPPERGLYTAIVAGFLISLLGGSRVQIGGPTGAFIVIVAGIVAKYGYPG